MWIEGQQRPQTFLVTVENDSAVRQEVEREYQKLEDILAELFPDSKVKLSVMADKLIVRGQAKDSEEAAQVMSIIRNNANVGGAGGGGGFGGVGGLGGGAAAQVLSDWEAGQTSANRPRLQVVNMLRVPGVQQVALRVKIAEVNRTAARGFGVDVAGHINFSTNPRGASCSCNRSWDWPGAMPERRLCLHNSTGTTSKLASAICNNMV
jgi:pilus assembly protein CpaC